MKYGLLILFTLLSLNGCGGGSSSGSGGGGTPPSGPSEVDMQQNRQYTVYPGDKIIKTSDNAEVTISHKDGQQRSTVTLIAGSAQIIRK